MNRIPGVLYFTLTLLICACSNNFKIVCSDASNAFYIKKVTGDWDENKVTWKTQPETTSEGQVIVSDSKVREGAEDYSVDVTGLVNSLRYQNKGIMIQLAKEENYARVSLVSNDAPAKRKPALEIIVK